MTEFRIYIASEINDLGDLDEVVVSESFETVADAVRYVDDNRSGWSGWSEIGVYADGETDAAAKLTGRRAGWSFPEIDAVLEVAR